MKIVHLTWGLGVGGSETLLCDIAAEQAAAHETWILVVNDDIDASIASEIPQSVKRVTLGRTPGSSNPWYLAKLILWLRRIKPDVVHAHQESFSRFRRLIHSPMVLTVHNTRLPLSDGLMSYDSVCCISNAVRKDVLSRFPHSRPRVIYNGANFGAVRQKVRYGNVPFRIVQVGRLAHEHKGQDLLIQSLGAVLARFGRDQVRVDFIGEGESRGYLQQLCAECGVEHQCRFLGAASREAIYAGLHDYDLLVQPSRYEGFGLTVIEGIAAGLPVLVSDTEGPLEIIADGELGWSFGCGDPEDLSRRLIELIAASRQPDFRARMQSRTELARSRFDVRMTARGYLDQYAKVASGAMPASGPDARTA